VGRSIRLRAPWPRRRLDWIARDDQIGAAMLADHRAVVHDEHVAERAPVDVESRVILFGLEHEHGRVGAHHAMLHRQRDDRPLLPVAVLLFEHARNLRLGPRALEEGRRGGDGPDRHRLPVDDHVDRTSGGNLGVDRDLIARLHAVEMPGVGPGSPLDCDRDSRAGPLAEAPHDGSEVGRCGQDEPVAREIASYDARERRVVADPSCGNGVDPFDASRTQRRDGGAELLRFGCPGGGHSIGHEDDPLSSVPCPRSARPDERRLEVGCSEGAAVE
jgi:hypothetical protein